MGTLIMKCTAILALLIAAAIKPTTNLQMLLGFVVCAGGVAVGAQAVRAHKYIWAAMFFCIAAFFNPVVQFKTASAQNFVLSLACAVAFVISLFLLENIPARTIASITEQNPGSESL